MRVKFAFKRCLKLGGLSEPFANSFIKFQSSCCSVDLQFFYPLRSSVDNINNTLQRPPMSSSVHERLFSDGLRLISLKQEWIEKSRAQSEKIPGRPQLNPRSEQIVSSKHPLPSASFARRHSAVLAAPPPPPRIDMITHSVRPSSPLPPTRRSSLAVQRPSTSHSSSSSISPQQTVFDRLYAHSAVLKHKHSIRQQQLAASQEIIGRPEICQRSRELAEARYAVTVSDLHNQLILQSSPQQRLPDFADFQMIQMPEPEPLPLSYTSPLPLRAQSTVTPQPQRAPLSASADSAIRLALLDAASSIDIDCRERSTEEI